MTFLMRSHDNRARRSIVTSIMPATAQGCIARVVARRPAPPPKTCPSGAAWTF